MKKKDVPTESAQKIMQKTVTKECILFSLIQVSQIPCETKSFNHLIYIEVIQFIYSVQNSTVREYKKRKSVN